MAATDWDKIKAEYIAGGTTYKALAEKHGISVNILEKRAVKEKWTKSRRKTRQKMAEKMEEKVAKRQASAAVDDLAVARYTAQIFQDALKDVAKLFQEKPNVFALNARNIESLANAINKNVDSLMKTCKVLGAAEAKKLELEERRLKLEEMKFEAEQKAKAEGEGKGIEVVLNLPEGVSVG